MERLRAEMDKNQNNEKIKTIACPIRAKHIISALVSMIIPEWGQFKRLACSYEFSSNKRLITTFIDVGSINSVIWLLLSLDHEYV